ncbi:MAG: M16 family metallopeptidase [Muribaculaceae bacterium]
MKRLKRVMLMALVAVGVFQSNVMAQMSTAVPVDTAVRIGKLPNGLTYYIRHNEYPKGQAEFYIAQKVGSIVENDNQRGLAHFLEHMCFNGTKTFKGNDMLKWCESNGIKFGANVNAATGVDQTVYNISKVPTARVGIQDTCLIILRDWADGLLLDGDEIDSERKVIHEEWRMRMVGQMRILENLLPEIYPNSRYGYRLPIGTMDVVDNFPHQALRDYYETWYRPDLQGVIVVGDIDVDRIECKIKELFGGIEMPANPKPREYYPVEDNKETIYAIGVDKEQPTSIAQIMFKHDAYPDSLKSNINYLAYKYVLDMATSMANSRLSEMTKKNDCPFAYSAAMEGDYLISGTKSAMTFVAVPKNDDMKSAFKAVMTEIARIKQHGFLASEYLRARDEYLSNLEKAYNNRKQQDSGNLVGEYTQHFLKGEPIPGIEYEYTVMTMLAKNLPVEMINQTVMQIIGDENRVVVCMMPEKEGVAVPTKAELQAIETEVGQMQVEAFVDNVKTEPLIAQLPAKGKVVNESVNSRFGAKEWTLSNGVKVVAKKTDFKDDEIVLRAVAKGGTSWVSEADADNLAFLPIAMQQIALGDFNASDLEKYLAGKQVHLQGSPEYYARNILGSTTPKDLQTLMEMLYMSFTNIRLDADEFEALRNQMVSVLQNQVTTPEFVFQTRMRKALYKSAHEQMISIEGIKNAKCDRIEQIIKQCYSNAAEFTFIFTGNFDEAQLKEYCEQYLASLPTEPTKVTKNVKFVGLNINPGSTTQSSTMAMQTPQTYASFIVSGNMPFSSKNSQLGSIVSQILSARFIEQIREKEGATYSVHTNASVNGMSDFNIQFDTTLPMKPEKRDRVVEIVKTAFNDLQTNCSEEELQKAKEYNTKSLAEGLRLNGYWAQVMCAYELTGVDMMENAQSIIDGITKADINSYMKALMKQNNFQIYILDPEK